MRMRRMQRSLPPLGPIDSPVVVAMVLTAVAVALALTVPAVLDRTAATTLARTIEEAPIETTGVRLITVVDLSAVNPEDPFRSEDEPSHLPSMFRPLTEATRWFETPTLNVEAINNAAPSFGATISIRSHQHLDRLATTVERIDPDLASSGAPSVIDISMTSATATSLQLRLGDELSVSTDTSDPIPSAYRTSLGAVTLRVASIIELTPPEDPVWFGDDRMHEARLNDTPLGFDVAAVVALEPSALLASTWAEQPGSLVRRLDASPLVERAPSLARAERWANELRGLRATTSGTAEIGEVRPVTRLDGLLATAASDRNAAFRVVVTMLVATAVVMGLAVLRLIQHSIVSRRRTFAVLRSRGASPHQLITASAVKGGSAGAAAALAGVAASQAIQSLSGAGAIDGTRALLVSALTAVGAAVAAGLVAWSHVGRSLAAELRERAIETGAIQLVLDLMISSLAVAAALILSRRGAVPGRVDATGAFAVASLTLCVGIIARRLLVAGSRHLRTRSFTATIAQRNLGQGRSFGPLLVDVVVAGVMVLAIAASILAADRDQLIDRSWEVAGAPVRITSALGASLDVEELSRVDGVEVVALEASLNALFAVSDETLSRADVVAIDHAAVQALTSDDPARPFGTVDLSQLEPDGSIPVLVSPQGMGRGSLPTGSIIESIDLVDQLTFTVVGNHGMRGLDGPTIVTDKSLVEATIGRLLTAQTAWMNDGSNIAELRRLDSVGQLAQRSEVVDELATDPQRQVLRRSMTALLITAAIITVLSTGFGALLVADQRSRQSSILSALGASRATIANSVATEVMLTFAVALIAGLVGAAVALRLVASALSPPSVNALPLITEPVIIGAVALTIIAGTISVLAPRRHRSATTRHLRMDTAS